MSAAEADRHFEEYKLNFKKACDSLAHTIRGQCNNFLFFSLLIYVSIASAPGLVNLQTFDGSELNTLPYQLEASLPRLNAAVLEIELLKGDVLNRFKRASANARRNVISNGTGTALMSYKTAEAVHMYQHGTELFSGATYLPNVNPVFGVMLAAVSTALAAKETCSSIEAYRLYSERVKECDHCKYMFVAFTLCLRAPTIKTQQSCRRDVFNLV